jgi:hypothetical protein
MARDAIDQVTRSIRVPSPKRQLIERELRAHLEDSRRDLEMGGMSHEDAVREAVERLGDPTDIAVSFDAVYRPNRRSQLGVAVLLASTMLFGAFSVGSTLAGASSAHPAKHAHVVKATTPSHFSALRNSHAATGQ